MKKNIFFALIALITLFTSCEEDNDFKDVTVTAVKNLYEPVNDKYVVLQSVSNVYFEWEKAYAEDNSVVYYEILFDTQDGDFSDPIYVASSDNRGLSTGATMTTKVLNNIAALAGAGTGEEITLKWAVRSNRGLNFVLSEETRSLTVVRLISIESLQAGELLYITGEGSEDGQQFKKVEEGSSTIFEMYTQLEADKPYHFYSDLAGNQRVFAVTNEGDKFNEVTNSTVPDVTVSEGGVYRIRLDFETASVTFEKIDKLEIRISWTSALAEFTYAGKGVWKLMDYNVQLTSTSWGFDERYKIVFTIDGQNEEWGQFGPFYDNRPDIDRPGYRDMKVTGTGQWEGDHFKFPEQLCDGDNLNRYTCDVTIYMTADIENYTHDFDNIRE
ncbi:SusE domain-containing protein [Plebeiibacterium sediminum]|uniref:SusE domain-containing protein n=1 Tax=Plebeiibacterium sediminum TaxID=2992112 RepID=A0AAE3SHP8_9BACT|nr:SusE domain-containing protein [Plebeiobacterium sediminum]MCW3789482.1 SusE domain-containing protein [Plebeiobacterium sediminum]